MIYLISVCIPPLASAFSPDTKWTCDKSPEVANLLASNNESVFATGIIAEGNFFMTLWANPSGDWTLVATNKTAEFSCVVSYGNKFNAIKHKTFI